MGQEELMTYLVEVHNFDKDMVDRAGNTDSLALEDLCEDSGLGCDYQGDGQYIVSKEVQLKRFAVHYTMSNQEERLHLVTGDVTDMDEAVRDILSDGPREDYSLEHMQHGANSEITGIEVFELADSRIIDPYEIEIEKLAASSDVDMRRRLYRRLKKEFEDE
jgi:hypothetical protein